MPTSNAARDAYFAALSALPDATLRAFDIDAFADGVIAHRQGQHFHENPHGTDLSVPRLSWAYGWNERALRSRA